jgi:uncharacterized protein YjeT (DUF2065 family)
MSLLAKTPEKYLKIIANVTQHPDKTLRTYV